MILNDDLQKGENLVIGFHLLLSTNKLKVGSPFMVETYDT